MEMIYDNQLTIKYLVDGFVTTFLLVIYKIIQD